MCHVIAPSSLYDSTGSKYETLPSNILSLACLQQTGSRQAVYDVSVGNYRPTCIYVVDAAVVDGGEPYWSN